MAICFIFIRGIIRRSVYFIVPNGGLCYDFCGEDSMRQVKRFVYFVLLNVIISTVTVIAVLQWWETKHPPYSADTTPVVIVVTATQSVILPLLSNNSGSDEIVPMDEGVPISGTVEAVPTFELLTYQVKEGDILGALAVEFNVSVADIISVNNFSDPNSLTVGQIIFIPTAPLPKPTSTAIPPTARPSATVRPATPTPGPKATATLTQVVQEAQVTIEKVVGMGELATERVQLLRSGDGELSLAGWRLDDGKGTVYTFPMLTLYKGGAISLNTRTGQDTVVDLFWGLTAPIWSSGETVYLYDAQNELRSTYVIP
jgi:LysM repeat protein